MKHSILITILVLFCMTLTCHALSVGPPNYADQRNWYGGIIIKDKKVDVLFFPPTSVSDADGEGRNMNPDNEKQRKSMDYWYAMAKVLFGEDCNFFGPYYRQVTMESWGKPYFNDCYALALEDVVASFDYYMKYHNNGRPFILAGHSQGAKLIYSLIKVRINDTNYPLMVAAYPIGYRISTQDLKSCDYIRPARNAVDVGVCVSYHTAAASSLAMFPNNAININPLNWSTGTTIAHPSLNLGSVFFDTNGNIINEFKGVISAQIDPATKCIIAKGIDPSDFYAPYLGGYQFRKGNYHLQDINFFFRNLQQNVKDRIASYFYKTQL